MAPPLVCADDWGKLEAETVSEALPLITTDTAPPQLPAALLRHSRKKADVSVSVPVEREAEMAAPPDPEEVR